MIDAALCKATSKKLNERIDLQNVLPDGKIEMHIR